jgi:hypothetical protein
VSYRSIPVGALRRALLLWQGGRSLPHIATRTGVDRRTLKRYVAVAHEVAASDDGAGYTKVSIDELLVRVLVALASKKRRPTQDALEQWRDEIFKAWLTSSNLTACHAQLRSAGLDVSYASLRRFLLDTAQYRANRRMIR